MSQLGSRNGALTAAALRTPSLTKLAATVAAALAALLAGAVAARQPQMTLGLTVAAGLVAFVFRKPAVGVSLLVFLTAVVPYGVQNQLGIGGGGGAPGLLLSDILLLSALGWALLALTEQRLARRELRLTIALLVFLALVVVQFFHGFRAGNGVSQAGQDLRVLLSIGLAMIVFPLLAEERTRRQLLIGLLACGLALGAWGMLQWFGHVQFGAAQDVGVRPGVRLTTTGIGQLQGGEYGFPIVIVMSFAVLAGGMVRSRIVRALLGVALVLNAVSCLVTFERTFWLATLLGCTLVLLRTPPHRRVAVLVATPFVLVLGFAVLTAVAPNELATASQRLLSLGQYGDDDSVRYRVVESRHVIDRIKANPVTGSGLAATIFWGQPWAQVPAESTAFSHNGYLWLAWRLGIPGAALLILMMGWAILLRAPPGPYGLLGSLRTGAQGALATLLVVMVTFPSLSALSITAVIGVLLGLAVAKPAASSASVPVRRPLTAGGRRKAAHSFTSQ
jgi:O-antigen ligase